MRSLAVALLLLCCGPAWAAFDHAEFGRAVRDIQVAMENRDYDRLERIHERLLEPDARTLDGMWMIEAFEQAFARFRYDAPAATRKLFDDWRKDAPTSALRPIAEAFAWKERAWIARGSGCYAQRPSSARKAFNDLVARAADALREGEPRSRSSPLWHTAALLVAGAQGQTAAQLDALLEESARAFPGYVPIYAARMTFLLPDWGGDFDAVDRFVRSATERTRAAEGRAFYAWLYLRLSQGGCSQVLDQSGVNWPELRDGFEDMLERHPTMWNRNVYATFACRARDADTTARLLGELGKDANLGIWSPGITTEGCREMVRPTPPPTRST